MKTKILQVLMKCFFNEGLVMFDKLKVKAPERKLQLVWDKI